MVNKDRPVSFKKFFKILFFIAVHNAQRSIMQSVYLTIQRKIASGYNTVPKI